MSASVMVACACCGVEQPRQDYPKVEGSPWRWKVCEPCREDHLDKPGSCRRGQGQSPTTAQDAPEDAGIWTTQG